MTGRRAIQSYLKKLADDIKGGVTVVWAFLLSTIIVAVGAAIDLSQARKARLLAQIAADNMALIASAAVDRNNPDRFTQDVPYAYSEIGGPSQDFTGTMSGVVQYDIQDGDDKLIARATVSGTYNTLFMSLFGKPRVDIKAVSDVSYVEQQGTPASVFFVADNSGSMGYSNGEGLAKIDSLEASLISFMDTLKTLDNDGIDDTFRTAMYPFSADVSDSYNFIDIDGVIPGYVVDPTWGTISNNKITSMDAHYGTDSSGSLQDAADAFKFEDAIHLDVNGTEDPLKYLVFMTDGANNQSNECTIQQVWVENTTAEYWWRTNRRGEIRYRYQEPFNVDRWTYVPPTSDGEGYYEDQEVCTTDYHFDVRSLEACDQMKNDGVLIFTIAYDVDESQKDHAREFLQSCSSGDNFFKEAEDHDALKAAFDAIGASILTEIIRIKR